MLPPPYSWWDPSIMGPPNYEKEETYTRNKLYFLHNETQT